MSDAQDLKQVLILDDNGDNLAIMKRLFENAGTEVTATQDPHDSVKIAIDRQKSETPFNLIVLDIRMPNMDGNEVAAKIREGGYQGSIIAFTANATMGGKSESTSAGINAYFSKTVLKKDLVQALVSEYSS